ncbi:hypothetical protein CKJ56_00190 [Mycobacterium intracellulare subsp. chimaera]|nr:hypothetical protein CKJ58_00835 [Mycobacterium intracellulare subsp. chimaera]PBA61208.1 hypothetical protein CKJ56_12580 [Mycobacterium intracellulare subsp. chimaera]PBA61436.1 hypothetical protein CKJ56_00190 [Mycobacterium intracellulare subsp. chimaera]
MTPPSAFRRSERLRSISSRRRDVEANEDRILQGALDVLNKVDGQLSMGRLANAVGLSRATLYRHFPNRESLMSKLTERAIDEGSALLETIPLEQPSTDEIRRLASAFTVFADRYSFLISGSTVVGPGLDTIGLNLLIERWQQASLIRADLPTHYIASSFTALAVALRQQAVLSCAFQEIDRGELLFTMFCHGVVSDHE